MSKKAKCKTRWCRGAKGRNSKFCSKCMMRAWRANNPMKARLTMLRQRAKRKKLPFDLDLNWLKDFLEKNFYDPLLHHIDRISSLGGYTKHNLQVLPFSENIAKGNRERHGQGHLY